MSSINGIGSNNPVNRVVNNPVYRTVGTSETPRPGATDRLELSGISHLLGSLKTNDVRTDKVADIRAQLAAGTYETDDKLNGAVDKLLDDVL